MDPAIDTYMNDSPNGMTPGSHATDVDANVISLKGMFKDYFLDYASYVILERAVPAIDDGLKPVQRRILHSLRQMDDGRFHKVANVIGQTMQYHPHGDAAIGDALVNLGQKDLLIDCQGNWGDARTGDRAAAPRYIEARLTKFALDVAFNPQTTEWQVTYDGRKKEPLALPMKFPLLLAQGADGIAVGLSTKILPHNFVELIKASIKILQGKPYKILPDFPTGGTVDVTDYNKGKRGGKVKVRARIEKVSKNQLAIRDLPYGVTTESLIDSVVKANDKGKIKIKKITDNTAKDVEILVDLATGISPDVTMDALYAFTNCGVSYSPNACVIVDDKPHFLSVHDILETCTQHTKDLLEWELRIQQAELEEKWHFASLEKIFIQNRIYREIEEAESWEAVLEIIDAGLKQFVWTPSMPKKRGDKRLKLMRDITEEDITRLTEIRIRRISKYNAFKADEKIAELEKALAQTKYDLEHLTDYAVAYFEDILKKYGKGRERKTEIAQFDNIKATAVVANNAKLYVNRKEGFVGMGLKKDEFVTECSDIDDIIVFLKNGKMKVTKIDDKTFVGKNIVHVGVWKKGDERTTYNMIYTDGKTGNTYGKRFNVKGVTRDREYPIATDEKGSKVHHFEVHPNGEAEVVNVQLTPASTARKKSFDFDFADLEIKGRGAKGNIITKYPVRKVTLKELGKSTLGAMEVWMDEVSGRLNTEGRGIYIGGFDTGCCVLVIYNDGTYEMGPLDLARKFEPKELQYIGKHDPKRPVSAVYYDGEKGWTYVKRFIIDTKPSDTRYPFITEHRSSKLFIASVQENPTIAYSMRVKRQKIDGEVKLGDFMDVKGWRAKGNKLSDVKLVSVKNLTPAPKATPAKKTAKKAAPKKAAAKLKPGDSIELDAKPKDDGQAKLF